MIDFFVSVDNNVGKVRARLVVNASMSLNNLTTYVQLAVDRECISGDLYVHLSDIDQLGLSIDSAQVANVYVDDERTMEVFVFGEVTVSLLMDDGSVKIAFLKPRVFNHKSKFEKLLCYNGLVQLRVSQDYVKHTLISHVGRIGLITNVAQTQH
jgi:hypothetical protein